MGVRLNFGLEGSFDACTSIRSFILHVTFYPSAIAARVPEPEEPRGELGLSRPRQAELEADAEQEPAAQPDQEADARVSPSLQLRNFLNYERSSLMLAVRLTWTPASSASWTKW